MVEKIEVTITPFNTKRTLHIHLPKGYRKSKERYPVMYMYDGHNLFSDSDATYGKSWGLETFLNSYDKPFIVVGIECDHKGRGRLEEYCPYTVPDSYVGPINGRAKPFMEWVVHELKPWVDSHYRTIPFRECTAIGGSSMGGLMSLYTVMKYNLYFSKAACVSPSIFICEKDLWKELGKIDPDTRVYMSLGGKESKDPEVWIGEMERYKQAFEQQGAKCMVYLDKDGGHNEASWEKQNKRYFDMLWK